ncbi:ribosome assembly cofactor RimP [uncultured Alistipes sp.]|uniref:ribosome assembly cofactor RimP n=1 Tax=uncultured Alistipes sp. TaxID=538949 RepID=UPI002613EA48|nr:ribosome assembly cofactor RimP [uncultured Alistipes sp.]
MIDTEQITKIVEERLEGTDLFLVSVQRSPSDELEIVVDSDTTVGLDACVELSRAVSEALEAGGEDVELTVSSAGVGRPLTLPRQFRKTVGRKVDVVTSDGGKLTAELADYSEPDGTLVLRYEEKVLPEGKKRKVLVVRERTVALQELASVCEHLDFK